MDTLISAAIIIPGAVGLFWAYLLGAEWLEKKIDGGRDNPETWC